jgi:2-oxoglutarate ferredoxin oxidoreductase subunit alpha
MPKQSKLQLVADTNTVTPIKAVRGVNDFVVKFANVNGTGSASANNLFARTLFRMGLDVVPKNIFPSNIQGLPTWYEVRVNEHGFLGRRGGGADIMVSVNPQSMQQDMGDTSSGGYFMYDSTKPLGLVDRRADIHYIGIPMMRLCMREFNDLRKQQLLKNMCYVGALLALLDMDYGIMRKLVEEQFSGRDKLIKPNFQALEMGRDYALEHYDCPLGVKTKKRPASKSRIMMEGNMALALGAIYGGATVAAWYPITPSTSVVDAFSRYAQRLRIDAGNGRKKYAVIQAEDELSAIGMVIGAGWNGARAFTATSGPGVSLMSEFLGLAYFAEVPAVLFNIQRAGPSTGMPTRTQQSDILSCVYASHGDTKQVLLIPSTPQECFDMAALSFDLAEQLQTPIILMSDLDLGMNFNISEPLKWNDKQKYKRGKVLSAEDLDQLKERYGRYVDSDADGVCYRTLPGTHSTKGSFFTRGTSRDEYAVYTELGQPYKENMERLLCKWETAKSYVPKACIDKHPSGASVDYGMICYGSSTYAVEEAAQLLEEEADLRLDVLRLRAVPFGPEVVEFIAGHKICFVVEQNRDGQMRQVLMNECALSPEQLVSVLHFDGTPITASLVRDSVVEFLKPKVAAVS